MKHLISLTLLLLLFSCEDEAVDTPPGVSNVTSVDYTGTEMTVQWEQSTDEDFQDYKLFYATSEDGEQELVATYTDISTTSHSISEFNATIENWFFVQVTNTAGLTTMGTGMTNSLDIDLLFVACEGNFGSGDGSIEVFRGQEKIQTLNNVGDVVQSILVFEDDLFVAVNNSHTIKKYDITESGLSLPGIEVSTEDSSPREMCVVDNKLYFTNWITQDIKVLDLYNYTVSTFSTLSHIPEDIVSDGNFLFVSAPQRNLYDGNQGSLVVKIDLLDGSIVEYYEVGLGPEQLYLDGNMLYVSRTSYDENWSASFGSSKVDISSGEIEIVTYGAGTACRADIFKRNNSIYRATSTGAVPLDAQLNLNMASQVGDLTGVYSGKVLNNQLMLGSTDYAAPDAVYLYNNLNEFMGMLEVNVLPGDFQMWSN